MVPGKQQPVNGWQPTLPILSWKTHHCQLNPSSSIPSITEARSLAELNCSSPLVARFGGFYQMSPEFSLCCQCHLPSYFLEFNISCLGYCHFSCYVNLIYTVTTFFLK